MRSAKFKDWRFVGYGRIEGITTKLAGFSVRLYDAEMIGHAMSCLLEEYEAELDYDKG